MRERNPDDLTNRELNTEGLQHHGRFRAETICHWEEVIRARRLSTRSGLSLLRVARTVADLRASDQVTIENLISALRFRSFDVAEPGADQGPSNTGLNGSSCSPGIIPIGLRSDGRRNSHLLLSGISNGMGKGFRHPGAECID